METIDLTAGCEIKEAISSAIGVAAHHSDECTFGFNGVTIIVSEYSDPDLIYRDWSRAMNGYLGEHPIIGPHPYPELSEEELRSDAEIESNNNRKRAERQAEYEKRQEAMSRLLEGALSNAGPIELSDENAWDTTKKANGDPYGSCCIRYAENWARLMQTRIDNGESLADCAGELSELADIEGITGFMHGMAVSILANCWKHGEELRLWHNRKTQIQTEGEEANRNGGVLNPAILKIS